MMPQVMHWLKIFLELTKFRISLFTAFSTSLGFLIAQKNPSSGMFFSVLGVFLIASGGCGLNQYQERNDDRWMERTKARPLPSGKFLPKKALLFSLGLIVSGFFILIYWVNWIACGLALFALFWYNGFYTYLKRKSAFATIPGALVGAIPPLIGWVSAKGSLSYDPQILALSLFFFMWQVPHFWLLFLNYSKDYEKAGFPTLTRIFSGRQLRRLTFVWICATFATCTIIPLFGTIEFDVILGGLIIAGLWLIWKSAYLLRGRSQPFFSRTLFTTMNGYMLLVMALFTLDKLIH